jgi:hypothetical protein
MSGMETVTNQPLHSPAWHLQTVLAFVLSLGGLVAGIAYLPADGWIRAYLAMISLFTVSSAISLTKTLRDEHEHKRTVSRVDQAKLDRFLAEQDPFKVP